MSREAFADLGKIALSDYNPCPGRILVRREPTPERFGKIELIQKKSNDKRFIVSSATVIKMGPPQQTSNGNPIEYSVNVGDRVLLDKFAGHDMVIDGDDNFVTILEHDIIGVLTPDAQVI